MLSIYICEDNPIHKNHIEMIIKDYITQSNQPMKIVFSSPSPDALLDYLTEHSTENSFFLLDVDLQHNLSGIVLASKIRELAPFSKIVFLTSHDKLAYLTFRYHVEALDYISKSTDDIKERVVACLERASSYHLERPLETDFFEIQSVEGLRKIPISDIMFFETHLKSYRLIIHLNHGRVEFNSTLKKVEEQIPSGFFRSHKSYLVNLKNIRLVNKLERTIVMMNGDTALLSRSKVKELLAAQKALPQ